MQYLPYGSLKLSLALSGSTIYYGGQVNLKTPWPSVGFQSHTRLLYYKNQIPHMIDKSLYLLLSSLLPLGPNAAQVVNFIGKYLTHFLGGYIFPAQITLTCL